MAKTAAQRQAAYRARSHHAGHDGNGERRLSVWVGIWVFRPNVTDFPGFPESAVTMPESAVTIPEWCRTAP